MRNKAFVYQNSTLCRCVDTSGPYAQPGQLPLPSYIPHEYRDVPQYPSAGSVFSNKRLVCFHRQRARSSANHRGRPGAACVR